MSRKRSKSASIQPAPLVTSEQSLSRPSAVQPSGLRTTEAQEPTASLPTAGQQGLRRLRGDHRIGWLTAVPANLNTTLTRVAPQLRYQLLRVGPAGLAGAAATLAAVIIASIALFSIRSATDSLAAQLLAAQQHPHVVATPQEAIGHVVSSLPTRDQMPAVIAEVLKQAHEAGVRLDKGQYTYSPARAGVGRYQLEIPVKAEYPNVRDFINRTLTAVPSAGLDKLHIERKVVGDSVVNADVRFVVFVRGG
jgi:hypothetical protein